jgi:RNA polymerase sigma-70 factor (ECF subfamily)
LRVLVSCAGARTHAAADLAELRTLAADYLRRERAGHTLQPTALVHEAYVRLIDQRQVDWSNRAQFIGLAA